VPAAQLSSATSLFLAVFAVVTLYLAVASLRTDLVLTVIIWLIFVGLVLLSIGATLLHVGNGWPWQRYASARLPGTGRAPPRMAQPPTRPPSNTQPTSSKLARRLLRDEPAGPGTRFTTGCGQTCSFRVLSLCGQDTGQRHDRDRHRLTTRRGGSGLAPDRSR